MGVLLKSYLGRGYAGIAAVALAVASTGPAMATADGPDAWRVVGVAANDTLNVRMGPGTDYPVIGRFAHDARGLRQITCVPLVTAEQHFAMTEAERAALPQRWCLMQTDDNSLEGWVAQRFLGEDYAPAQAATDTLDVVADAERLVQRLYDEHLRAVNGGFTSPLAPSRMSEFFSQWVVESRSGTPVQADPLFDAQDIDIAGLRIARDSEQPMFRGMITVNVSFRNFGRPHQAVVRLRYEDGVPRIIRIEHEGWTFE